MISDIPSADTLVQRIMKEARDISVRQKSAFENRVFHDGLDDMKESYSRSAVLRDASDAA